jgi:hypothetical protein
VHEFSLVVERDVPLSGAELAALRPYGCVAISRDDAGRGVAMFETEHGTYHEAVEAAIRAAEALGEDARVTEITGVPMPMPGLRIVTTLTRAEWERLGEAGPASDGPSAGTATTRRRLYRFRWWPVYVFVVALFVVGFISESAFTWMAAAGVALAVVLMVARMIRG